jgi:hypothetical protein
MDKLAVQSRYTRINYWYRPPHVVRFSNHLIRQLLKSGEEPSNHARAPLRVATGPSLSPGNNR